MSETGKNMIYLVGIECPSKAQKRFLDWLTGKHVSDLLKAKGVRRLTRYQRVEIPPAKNVKVPTSQDTYPGMLVIFEFKNRETFEAWTNSPELSAARSESASIYAETGAKLLWRANYEFTEKWEP